MRIPGKKLNAKTISVHSLTTADIKTMYHLFEGFYDDVSLDVFKNDLMAKNKVILMSDRKNIIRGFSTLTTFQEEIKGKKYFILYSGDTIIDPDFWGTAALTMEFLKNIILAKLKRPFTPVWWFLISKGYKTYLLLANNFLTYYPRFDRQTPPHFKALIDRLAERLYPGNYSSQTGIISFEGDRHEKLKAFVSPITDQLETKYPKIKFFNQINPGWSEGNELACVGKVELLLALVHPWKVLMKSSRKFYQNKLVPRLNGHR